MNVSKLTIGAIFVIILFCLLLEPLLVIYKIENDYNHIIQLKTNIGDTNDTLIYPWGTAPDLSVFLNIDNISIEDRNLYTQNALDSMNWWEKDNTYNLSYPVKFKIVNNSEDANIILSWVNTVSSNPTDRGYTHINSSGIQDPLGKNLCDTYNPPYSRCVIEIRTNLSYGENLHTVKHEFGHVLGLKHRFNIMDYYKTGFEEYLCHDFEDSELMFDFSVYASGKNFYKKYTIF